MFYKFISKNQIEPAPKSYAVTKIVNGNKREFLCTTPSEAMHAEHGCYPLIVDDYPQDGYQYTPFYEKDGLVIRQRWERGEKIATERLSDVQQAFSVLADKVQGATTIKALREALIEAANQIGEVQA